MSKMRCVGKIEVALCKSKFLCGFLLNVSVFLLVLSLKHSLMLFFSGFWLNLNIPLEL